MAHGVLKNRGDTGDTSKIGDSTLAAGKRACSLLYSVMMTVEAMIQLKRLMYSLGMESGHFQRGSERQC